MGSAAVDNLTAVLHAKGDLRLVSKVLKIFKPKYFRSDLFYFMEMFAFKGTTPVASSKG